ncbi:hypothetical protein EUTSA_v10028236mg, partial [Eutrema salsugineum]
YKCDLCEFYVHEECISVNIPSRHKHPLKFTYHRQRDGSPWACCLCENDLDSTLFYHCLQCSFFICVFCVRKPLIFAPTKIHEHELHQLPMKLSFTCDACGLCTTNYPCICLQCCFKIHRECIFLPRVIHISRHDHRISHVFPIGHGKWTCEICYEDVNGNCGAYSCLVCSYVAHSKCVRYFRYWDKQELEGIPEKDEKEESKPFEVIDQDLIKHFSHEHNLKVSSISSLRFDEDALPCEEDKSCYACTINSELGYKCTQCDFILHDAGANLPRKKRYFLCIEKLTLFPKVQPHFMRHWKSYFSCAVCGRYCTGFMYTNSKFNFKIDVLCASISDVFKHKSHPHWLFLFIDGLTVRCEGCDLYIGYYLHCKGKDDCGGFNLCFRCATLPTLVRHKYDDHPLSLYYGEKNVNSLYCCGICEKEIYSKGWFYKCDDCGSTLHTKCVFKDLIHPRPGSSLTFSEGKIFDLLPTNRLSRPICYLCKTRCMGDVVLNYMVDKNLFKCGSCTFPET